MLNSRFVPYVNLATSEDARAFLPAGPDDRLTVDKVRRFRKAVGKDPEVGLVVLGTLRAHGANGAEAPLSGTGVLFAALSIVVAVMATSTNAPAVLVLGFAYAFIVTSVALWILRVSLAAHARRVVATTWLGAYEDELRRKPPS